MISYTLSLERPSRHLFGIEIRVDTNGLPTLDLEFPAWSPGRYFIYDFARNVQELSAFGSGERRLTVEKIAKGSWRIDTKDEASIRITYRMYGDSLSGTFSQLDDRHASINGSSLFGYIVGRQYEPVELTIAEPEGWKSYCALKRRGRRGTTIFQAPNYDVLIDSPIEIGSPIARSFEHQGVTYHVILDIAGAEGVRKSSALKERVDRFVADTEKTVKAYTRIFGRPEFDEYYFLVNVDPYAPTGDGMEHLASTRLVINGYLTNDADYEGTVGVMSHEFFHIWNVKRLRPAELGPFDYTKERHTTLLWFAEGFTQYYGHLMLRRAGVWDDKQLFKHLAEEINTVDRSPGRFHRNLRDSSFDTWHAAGARNPIAAASNFRNTYVNYYHKGAVTALLLDVEIRRATSGAKSLDDLIIELYRTSYLQADEGEYFLRGTGYTQEDVEQAVEKIAGRTVRNVLHELIRSVEEVDYRRVMRYLGLTFERGDKGPRSRSGASERPKLYLGVVPTDVRTKKEGTFVTVANIIPDSAADRAGLSAGDLIVAIDGERCEARMWEKILEMKRPGEPMEITFFRSTRLLSLSVTGDEKDVRPIRIEIAKNATAGQQRALAAWLGSAPKSASTRKAPRKSR